MKRLKRMLLTMLSVAMVMTANSVPVYAGSNAGNTETTAIKLENGKKKNAKFRADAAAPVYFVIGLEKTGKLNVSVAADKLGTSAKITVKQTVLSSWSQETTVKYNKSKKTTNGSLKIDDVLQKGTYLIEVTPGKQLSASKKFSITAKVTPFITDDVEPDNNKEESAQAMNINKGTAYNMFFSSGSLVYADDTIDCFKFTTKKDTTLNLTLNSKVKVDGVKVLLRQKTDDGYTTVKSFDVKDGKLSEAVKVNAGTYYWKIWYSDTNASYQMPYTIKCVAK